jgi:hypothetical protein
MCRGNNTSRLGAMKWSEDAGAGMGFARDMAEDSKLVIAC